MVDRGSVAAVMKHFDDNKAILPEKKLLDFQH